MQEVFINYRNGDGDEAASALNIALSQRFGDDAIFHAPKSIAPGQTFQDVLINGVRHCSVLLAVIGPGWLSDPRLHNEDDWVRREILEAFGRGIQVMPILKGRQNKRLEAAELPEALKGLANVQSLRLDLRDDGTDIRHIGDVLVKRVPALKEVDRQAPQPSSEPVHNSVQENHGTVLQARDFTGNGSLTITSGPTHHHSGNTQHFSGDGATYIQGDSQGNISHRFGRSRPDEDDR